jgi:penicillin-binding protein 1A
VKLIERLGPRNVAEFTRRFGITGRIPPYLSLALGTAEITPLEMASAYGTFANHGIRVTPLAVRTVEDPLGRTLERNRPETMEVIDEQTNALIVSILQSVVEWGTAVSARFFLEFDAPAAGKTGTTDDYTDAWFIGFVPRCVCAVWVGFDEKRPIGRRMTGAKAALPIWVEFMKAYVAKYGAEDFVLPDGVVPLATCEVTGRLPTPDCPVIWDLFLTGTQPRDTCILHTLEAFGDSPDSRTGTWRIRSHP